MMKYSLPTFLLISNASFSEAMRLNLKFMPDLDEDNELIKSVSKLTSLDQDDVDMLKTVE
jgi:hypothetical protein